jgi:hypothetical protein
MNLPALGAKELGAILAASGIRWKVVVVSACYAGGFIGPLKDDGTLVITAARHDRSSFGCADENDFTYFGRAYFKEALPKSRSFQAAFTQADKLIDEWESSGNAPGRSGDARRGEAGESKAEGLSDPIGPGAEAPDTAASNASRRSKRKDVHSLPQMVGAAPIENQLERWWKQRAP